jgi:hypothetical protein
MEEEFFCLVGRSRAMQRPGGDGHDVTRAHAGGEGADVVGTDAFLVERSHVGGCHLGPDRRMLPKTAPSFVELAAIGAIAASAAATM